VRVVRTVWEKKEVELLWSRKRRHWKRSFVAELLGSAREVRINLIEISIEILNNMSFALVLILTINKAFKVTYVKVLHRKSKELRTINSSTNLDV
jgi:hypothetical protein